MTNVRIEGRSKMTMNVMIGLSCGMSGKRANVQNRAYEYHSHAEYSVLNRRDSVCMPECVVFEAEIMESSSA